MFIEIALHLRFFFSVNPFNISILKQLLVQFGQHIGQNMQYVMDHARCTVPSTELVIVWWCGAFFKMSKSRIQFRKEKKREPFCEPYFSLSFPFSLEHTTWWKWKEKFDDADVDTVWTPHSYSRHLNWALNPIITDLQKKWKQITPSLVTALVTFILLERCFLFISCHFFLYRTWTAIVPSKC